MTMTISNDKTLGPLNRAEVFSRDGTCWQIYTLPVVLSMSESAAAHLKPSSTIEMPGLFALGKILRAMPAFVGRAVEVAPYLMYADRIGEDDCSSIELARSGEWASVPDGSIDGHWTGDPKVLDRSAGLRHIYIRVAGAEPLEQEEIAVEGEAAKRLDAVLTFALTEHLASASVAGGPDVFTARALAIMPFMSAILDHDNVRNRAVLSHIAWAAKSKAPHGEAVIAYQVQPGLGNVNDLHVYAVRGDDEWQVEACIRNLLVDCVTPLASAESAEALLREVAASVGVRVMDLADQPTLFH